MKTFLIMLLIGIVNFAFAQNKFHQAGSESEKIDSVFNYNFDLLDEHIANYKADSTLRFTSAIHFMERTTGIRSSGSMTYIGKVNFTKNDLNMWHEWYVKNKSRLVWDDKNN